MGFIGILLSLTWIRRSRFGVERRLLEDHARWLVSGETVLILQAPIETLRIPMAVLLESGEIPPAVFVLHPRRESPAGEDWSPGNVRSIRRSFRSMPNAWPRTTRWTPNRSGTPNLLKRLDRGLRWIQQACLDLSEADRLEQSVSPTTEWLLDNEYILESNARDVRLNLPRRFYRQLPALTSEPDRGLPRIYGLARELASHTDLRLDQENILAFIEAYQSVKPLSIGELWAVPQMLRTALIEGIQQIAGRAQIGTA